MHEIRGATPSSGRTSWSGKPEILDYQSFLYLFLISLFQTQKTFNNQPNSTSKSRPLELILAGYSYGTIIVSRLPVPGCVAQILSKDHVVSKEQNERKRHIEHLARLLAQYFVEGSQCPTNQTLQSQSTSTITQADGKIESSILLVSPVLPPVSGLLAPLSGLSMFTTNHKEYRLLSRYPTLAIWGSSDVFTSTSRLKSWADGVRKLEEPGTNLKACEIEGAGHFWHESGAMDTLLRNLMVWIVEKS